MLLKQGWQNVQFEHHPTIRNTSYQQAFPVKHFKPPRKKFTCVRLCLRKKGTPKSDGLSSSSHYNCHSFWGIGSRSPQFWAQLACQNSWSGSTLKARLRHWRDPLGTTRKGHQLFVETFHWFAGKDGVELCCHTNQCADENYLKFRTNSPWLFEGWTWTRPWLMSKMPSKTLQYLQCWWYNDISHWYPPIFAVYTCRYLCVLPLQSSLGIVNHPFIMIIMFLSCFLA